MPTIAHHSLARSQCSPFLPRVSHSARLQLYLQLRRDFLCARRSSLTVWNVNWNDVMIGLWKGLSLAVLVESCLECMGTLI